MTRQPDPPDEAALRALADRAIEAEAALAPGSASWRGYKKARDAYRSVANPQAVLALLATLADLRARLAAVTAERDAAVPAMKALHSSNATHLAIAQEQRARAEAAEQQRDTARALLADVRPWFVCDATCLDCEEQSTCPTCPTRIMLAFIDAALSAPEGR